MGSFTPVIQALVGALIRSRRKIADWLELAAQFIRDHEAGLPDRPISLEKKNGPAALAFRSGWTRMSRTSPYASTARQSQYFRPLIGMTPSSKCHLPTAPGLSRHMQSVKWRPKRLTH